MTLADQAHLMHSRIAEIGVDEFKIAVTATLFSLGKPIIKIRRRITLSGVAARQCVTKLAVHRQRGTIGDIVIDGVVVQPVGLINLIDLIIADTCK